MFTVYLFRFVDILVASSLIMFLPMLQIRENALGILELGLKQILLAQQDVVPQLLSDLKGVSVH